MSRLVAFLRAINVGGHTVTMERLHGLFDGLGFKDVETFIASGNVIFTSRAGGVRGLEAKIEARLEDALGYEVKTFIRTGAEVAAVASYPPFAASRLQAAGALNIAFLAEPPGAAGVRGLMALRTDIDDFHVHGREIYWLREKKPSESTFSNAVLERTLKVRATIRGANTVSRLSARYGFSSPAG